MNLAELSAGNLIPPRHAAPKPLLPVAVGLGLGIIIDDQWAPSLAVPIALLACGVVFAFAYRARATRAICYATLVLAAASLGMVRHAASDRFLSSDHIAHYLDDDPMLTTLTGQIATAPIIREPDPDVPTPYPRSPSTKFTLIARRLTGIDGPLTVSGLVAINVRAPRLDLRVGQFVKITGWLYRPQGPANPYEFDWSRFMKHEGVFAGLSCDHAESVIIDPPESLSSEQKDRDEVGMTAQLAQWLDPIRTRLRGYLLDDAFTQDDPAAGVLAAMVLGHRSAVPRAMNEAFLRTGNAHLLAASGMQVAWLALVIWTIARFAGLYYRHTALIVGLVIISYVLIAEPRPSILRAGIVGVFSCSAAFFRGRYNSVNALAAAAVVILLFRPGDIFSAAFQFTFLATVGLLFFCPIVSRKISDFLLQRGLTRLARAFDGRSFALSLFDVDAAPPRWHRRILLWLGAAVAQLFALSISEWIITAPLSCYLFNNFMPWGWFGSFVIAFLAMPANIVGYLTVIARLAFPSAGLLLGPVLAFTTNTMLAVVNTLARIPGSVISGGSPSLLWVMACYGTIGLFCYWKTAAASRDSAQTQKDSLADNTAPRSVRYTTVLRRHGFKIAAVLLIGWWFVPTSWVQRDRHALKVWMMAVGDGTGTLIELPNGQTLLYDFGTRSSFDVLPVAREFLRRRGINRLDAVFLSHTDFDHFSAIARLAEDVAFSRVIITDHFERFAPKYSAPGRLLDALRDKGISIEIQSAPNAFEEFKSVRVEMLWPPPASSRRIIDANDTSMVLKLTYRDRSILLTGDITEAAMAALASDPRIRAEVLALPHHGSVVGNTAAFVDAVNPKVSVRSTGQRRALTTNGIDRLVGDRGYLSTADDGCICVTIGPEWSWAESFKSGTIITLD
ncbi:MAG: ComEC/Rec2 family competence protein [Planctomycetia bacterium]|nr:ComEC/Rec2 family competence protein [Planctomycetia bacterium]MCC7316084.1 ComEC/Rec2 family competence protein [Planctomycetota bacterium]